MSTYDRAQPKAFRAVLPIFHSFLPFATRAKREQPGAFFTSSRLLPHAG